MAMTLRHFSTLVILSALGSACTPSFEADLTEVEVTQRGVRIEALSGPSLACDVSVSGAFTLSSADTAWAKRVNTDVLVHRVKFAPGGGLPNLDFIKFARAAVAAETIPDSATEIIDYNRDDAGPSSSAIEVDMPVPVDITVPWSAPETVLMFQLAGHLPTQDWTVDVTLELSGKISYRY